MDHVAMEEATGAVRAALNTAQSIFEGFSESLTRKSKQKVDWFASGGPVWWARVARAGSAYGPITHLRFSKDGNPIIDVGTSDGVTLVVKTATDRWRFVYDRKLHALIDAAHEKADFAALLYRLLDELDLGRGATPTASRQEARGRTTGGPRRIRAAKAKPRRSPKGRS